MVFSKYTELHNPHHNLVLEHFSCPSEIPFAHLELILVSTPSLGNYCPLSLCVEWRFLSSFGMLSKGDFI